MGARLYVSIGFQWNHDSQDNEAGTDERREIHRTRRPDVHASDGRGEEA